MKLNCAICSSGLLGFIIGTALALGYVSSGASLLFLKGAWFRVLLFPGNLVCYELFDLVGYSAAVSLACFTVGLVYSAIASVFAALLQRVFSKAPDEEFSVSKLRRE